MESAIRAERRPSAGAGRIGGNAYLHNQGEMIGGDAYQFRIGDVDAGHFKPGADKDMVDAHPRKAAGKSALWSVVSPPDLNVPELATESTTHRR